MDDDLKLCTAAFFHLIGKDTATADEFVTQASMGQRWMAPSDAEALLKVLLGCGAVVEKNGYLHPGFDIDSVQIPLAYRPAKDILSGPSATAEPAPRMDDKDVLGEIMEMASSKGIERKTFVQECNKLVKRLDIDMTVAGLIVLRDAGADITPLVEDVRGKVRLISS